MGGMRICMASLQSSHPEVVWRAAECLASAVQNHMKLQNYMAEEGRFVQVVELLARDSNSSLVKSKLLRLVSSIAGGHPKNTSEFVAHGGIKLLVDLLSAGFIFLVFGLSFPIPFFACGVSVCVARACALSLWGREGDACAYLRFDF